MNKIIQLLGTSGSGKTTLARRVAAAYGRSEPIGPQKRPEAYQITPRKGTPLYLLGSYENECGGVDTIDSVDALLKLIWDYHLKGHVLFEGLLISTYLGKLARGLEDLPLHRFFLNTPIEECIKRVKARRLAAGNVKPFNEDNTRNRVKAITSIYRKTGGMYVASDGEYFVLEVLKK